MRLEIKCKDCKKDFELKSNAISRYDLENEMGRYFNTKCSLCQASNEYHVNKVYAEHSSKNIAIYVVMGFLAAIAILMFTLKAGFISIAFLIIPVFIYFKLKQASAKSVEQFNMHKISTHR